MLLRKRNRTVFYATKSLSSEAPKIWGLIPQSLKDETELSQFKTKTKTWTIANVHADWVKNIQIILVSFKLFLLIDFTILFNACVLYLFRRWFQRHCKTLIFLFPRSIADFLTFLSDRIARVFTRSRANRTVALDKSKAFDRVW